MTIPPQIDRDPDYSPWAAAFMLLMGNFMNLIDVSIVNVALPSIQNDFSARASEVEWISAGYVLAFAAGLLPFGRFGDKLGRKRLFLYGVTVFTLASGLCGLALNIEMLVGSRVVQGLGGAMMVPQVLAILHVLFEGEAKGRAFALAGVVASMGAVIGPLLGGALITADLAGLGWRPIFLVNLPVGILVLFFGNKAIPTLKAQRDMKVDWLGVGLFALAVVLVVFPVIEGSLLGWPYWCILMLISAAPVAILFYWRQISLMQAGKAQVLPVSLMRNSGYMSGIAMVMLNFSAIPGMFLILALYLQNGYGLTPWESGLSTAPFPLGVMFGSYITGRFGIRHLSPRIAIGAGCMLIGTFWLRHATGNPDTPLSIIAFAAPLGLCGLGMGLAISPLFQTVLQAVAQKDAGAGSGAMQAFQQVGAAIGIATTSSLFFVALSTDGGTDYAGAMHYALLYQIFAYGAILLILLAQRLMNRQGDRRVCRKTPRATDAARG